MIRMSLLLASWPALWRSRPGAGARPRPQALSRRIHAVVPRPDAWPRSNFDSRVDEESYSIKGTVASAGLGALFDDTKGTLSSTGSFSGKARRPDAFRADYVSGKKASMVDIRFSGGDVTEATNVPPPKKRGKRLDAARAERPRGVTDPIAATLVQADSLDKVCGAHGQDVRRRDARRSDADLRLERRTVVDHGLQGRDRHLPHALRAGGGLPQGPQGAELPEDQEPDHGDVCAARQNRRICADPRHGRHADRHDHGRGAAVRSNWNKRGAGRAGRRAWGARH